MDTEQTKYWVALSQVKGLGAIRFKKLEKRFRDLPDLLEENPPVPAWPAGEVHTPAVFAEAVGGG